MPARTRLNMKMLSNEAWRIPPTRIYSNSSSVLICWRSNSLKHRQVHLIALIIFFGKRTLFFCWSESLVVQLRNMAIPTDSRIILLDPAPPIIRWQHHFVSMIIPLAATTAARVGIAIISISWGKRREWVPSAQDAGPKIFVVCGWRAAWLNISITLLDQIWH